MKKIIMNVDNHSKNVILIGALHMVGYIMYTIIPLSRGITMLERLKENADDESMIKVAVNHFAAGAFYILMSSLSGLMIWGVVKKRYLLMAPWLVISSIIFVDMLVGGSLYMIGTQIIVLYPTYTLFSKLRHSSLKKESYGEFISQQPKPADVLTQHLCA